MTQYDVIIVGSGISALTVASQLCEKMNILMITKGLKQQSNSSLAQGGIAAAIGKGDHWKFHFEDTLYAGCFHNTEKAAKELVQSGEEVISSLQQNGMEFDVNDYGELLLGREGAHRKKRIIHAGGDATGKRLIEHFLTRLNERVTLLENHMVFDIEVVNNRAIGVWVKTKENEIIFYSGAHIILATGGCGALYEVTSNSSLMTGDGLAMAYRAGATLIDMEFIQFHPTMLYIDDACKGLISEAVRGEGAFLIDENGRRIMENAQPFMDLAPRDVVARVMQQEINHGHHIFLDISNIQQFRKRFPTITRLCEENGIDVEKGRIPVAPGMHFLMGGIETDLFGRTSIERLYAVGETACTGVHGANRLASNSLLEGLVFGKRLASYISEQPLDVMMTNAEKRFVNEKITLPSKREIQEMMMTYVGITRSNEGLSFALHYFEQFLKTPSFFTINVNDFTIEDLECMNMITVGWLIAKAAFMRKESRGGHYRIDFPKENDRWKQKRIRLSIFEHVGVI